MTGLLAAIAALMALNLVFAFIVMLRIRNNCRASRTRDRGPVRAPFLWT